MYQVLLVDDEPIILGGIQNFIPWESYGCKVAEVFEDGLSALEYLKENRVDIIVADIHMPGLDGLELSRIVAEKYPHIQMIILTGYSEFSYAQKAIQYHAADFILKNNPLEKLKDAIQRCVFHIKESSEKENRIREMENRLRQYRESLQNCFFTDLIEEKEEAGVLKARYEALEIEIESYYAVICQIHFSTPQRLSSKVLLASIHFISMSLTEWEHMVTVTETDMLCILLYGEKIKKTSVEEMMEIFQNIANSADKLLNLKLHFVSSTLQNDIFILPQVYDSLQNRALGMASEENHEELRPFVAGIYPKTVLAAISYMKKHFAENISLGEIAAYANVNASYLSSLFKKCTGSSVVEYLTAYRISMSRKFLIERNKKLYEIALMSGFKDAAYFSNIFKKYTGQSPSEFRDNYGKT